MGKRPGDPGTPEWQAAFDRMQKAAREAHDHLARQLAEQAKKDGKG